MGCYCFTCKDCKTSFEVSVKKVIDPLQVLCVDCSSPYVTLDREREDLTDRIDSLKDSVSTLTGRMTKVWEFYNEITGEGGEDVVRLEFMEIDDDGTRH